MVNKITRELSEKVAKDSGIDIERFCGFINERFPNEESIHYITEWAQRINSGQPRGYADRQTKAALEKFGW